MAGFAGLHRVDDPRDALDKARRSELLQFARANGVKEIAHDMPAIIMRRILRSKRLTNIRIPRRVLGQPEMRAALVTEQPSNVPALDASDELMRQYREGAMAAPAKPEVSFDAMTRAKLAKTCKAKGIAMARTDKKEDLIGKLTANG
jgi:hypothetical protein